MYSISLFKVVGDVFVDFDCSVVLSIDSAGIGWLNDDLIYFKCYIYGYIYFSGFKCCIYSMPSAHTIRNNIGTDIIKNSQY